MFCRTLSLVASRSSAGSIVVAGLALAAALWLAPRLVRLIQSLRRWRREHVQISALLADFPEAAFREILAQIESLRTGPSRGCTLIMKPAARADGAFGMIVPQGIPEFPWSGWRVSAQFIDRDQSQRRVPVAFTLHEPGTLPEAEFKLTTVSIDAQFFWPPYRSTCGKRGGHIFAVARYLKLSPGLKALAEQFYSSNPEALVEALLSDRGILRSPVRVGLAPEWIQGGRFQKCPQCRKAMRLVIQIEGSLIHPRLAEGNFYLFGCERHPHLTVTDEDWH